ncbi:hypothetical protein [Cupriavidus sp. TMH.W2]|uniref:hypothetical protein n=1 Tax=Cupriavidus sp. TMH.W2 TaxID=3434465 RepID=UPI003D76FF84
MTPSYYVSYKDHAIAAPPSFFASEEAAAVLRPNFDHYITLRLRGDSRDRAQRRAFPLALGRNVYGQTFTLLPPHWANELDRLRDSPKWAERVIGETIEAIELNAYFQETWDRRLRAARTEDILPLREMIVKLHGDLTDGLFRDKPRLRKEAEEILKRLQAHRREGLPMRQY